MRQDDAVYDLGEVDLDGKPAGFPPVFDAKPRPVSPGRSRESRDARSDARSPRSNPSRVGPALAGSLSLLFPGLGEVVAGELAWGLFYASGIGFCAAVVWASLTTIDRILPTLGLLGVPHQALAATILALTFGAMCLHLAGVLHAYAIGEGAGDPPAPHPIVAGVASLLLPGWGQLLAGHRRRATFFFAGLWILGVAWLLVIPEVSRLLARIGLPLPPQIRDGWGPVAMLAAPIVMWTIAVYDAAAGAAAERRGRDAGY